MKHVAIVLAILVLAAAAPAVAPAEDQAPEKRAVHLTDPERILGFHTDIVVRDDGSLRVTETIEVLALGREIRRGIYRDFPARQGSSGDGGETEFEIIEVLRDGKPESFHTVKLSSCTKIYIGKADIFLEPGEYTYTLAYLSTKGFSSHETEEELSWNENGTGMHFSMEKVSAAVTLPEGIVPETVLQDGYTGKGGEKGRDYRSWIDEQGRIRFERPAPGHPWPRRH